MIYNICVEVPSPIIDMLSDLIGLLCKYILVHPVEAGTKSNVIETFN